MQRKNNTYKSFFMIILIWIIMPIALFSIWLIGSLFSNPLGGFTTLLYPHSNKEYTALPKDNLLLKNTKVTGQFTSQENNLGIITLRVGRSLSTQQDEPLFLKFHIKEKQAKNWYYENVYNVGSLREDNVIVFGFPKISDSRGKIYEFELVSLNGNMTNAIAITKGYDSFVTRYIYSRKEISEKKMYMAMPYKKILSIISYPQVLLSSLIFMLPLVFYFLFVSLYLSRNIALFFSKHVEKRINSNVASAIMTNSFIQNYLKKSFLGSFTITLIVADIFLIQSIYYGIALGLLGFWIVAVVKDALSPRISLAFSLVWLLLSEVFILYGLIPQENKSAMWAYFFLVTAVVQILWKEAANDNKA